jgi:hypothetical protein
MKITKSQLKQIIQEELQNVLLEKHDCSKDHPEMTHERWEREQQQVMLEQTPAETVEGYCRGVVDVVRKLEETGSSAGQWIKEAFPDCFQEEV